MSVAVSGFLIGLSLIVAIGPQNALIIKQGIKREHVIPIVVTCLVSDIFLILGGTLGVGVIIESAPLFLTILKWVGVAYLLFFAYTCFRDARHKQEADIIEQVTPIRPPSDGAVTTKTRVIATSKVAWYKPVLTALAFTWLNPAAYIDVLVMLGGLANQYGEVVRWHFAFGALGASFVWFPTLGILSVKGADLLQRPQVWRLVNIAIGFVMIFMAVKVATF